MTTPERMGEISQSLPVPEHKMGWIVGKKGSYISQLCRKSGAHIAISESSSREYGIVWKYVQITGSGRAVDRAKKLLHIRLDRLEPRISSLSAKDVSEDFPCLTDASMLDDTEEDITEEESSKFVGNTIDLNVEK